MRPQNVLLLGGTGNIGSQILSALIMARRQLGRVVVLTSFRTVDEKPDLRTKTSAANFALLIGNFHHEADFKAACAGIDIIICALGNQVLECQAQLVQWAAQAGVRKFVPSEFGIDPNVDEVRMNSSISQIKRDIRKATVKSGILEYSFLVVGIVPEMFLSVEPNRFCSWDVKRQIACLPGDGRQVIGFTAMADIGTFLVALLLRPETTRNRIIRVNSFNASPLDITREFEKQTGSQWEVIFSDLRELQQAEIEALEEDEFDTTWLSLARLAAQGRASPENDNGVLGISRTDNLQNQVRRIIRRAR